MRKGKGERVVDDVAAALVKERGRVEQPVCASAPVGILELSARTGANTAL